MQASVVEIQTVLKMQMNLIVLSMDTAGQRLDMEEMVHLQTQIQESVGLTMIA